MLAPGSLNGFLTGKHFNRCKRLHPILGLALEIKHFKAFLVGYENRLELENWVIENHSQIQEPPMADSDVLKVAESAL